MSTGATSRAAELLDRSHSWDEVLVVLRDEGFSKVEAVRAAVEAGELKLPEAKQLVHASAAWSDRREPDERFVESLLEESESPSRR